MVPLETQRLVASDHDHLPEKDPTAANGGSDDSAGTNRLTSLILEPIQWLQMLSGQLNPTFILGVLVVYGFNQGFGGSYYKVVSDYYWKDVQKLQPSSVQLYTSLYYIPWILKPVWGLLTDVFPIMGYHRRPYFVLAGVVGVVSALTVSLLGGLPVAVALVCLIGLTAGLAMADVTIDACIARNSISMSTFAPDMQSLCSFCSSVGALIGYSTSGFFVHHIGAQGALGILGLPPALLIVLGFVIYELRSDNAGHHHPHKKKKKKKKKAFENLEAAVIGMWETIKRPQVWKPSLFMYLSLSLNISPHEGQFYWYTNPKAGPGFSQEFMGMIYAIGAFASIVGVLIYQKTLKNRPFRSLLFWAQLLYGLSGMLDLVFVLRWNLALGIPDSFFVITEECVSRIVSRIRWMPMIVLSTRLCPSGIEGTFFALLMCIDSLGFLSSKWGGGMVLHAMHVTRNDFRNLWLVILIRNLLRLSTLGLIFLIPRADQYEALVAAPPDQEAACKDPEARGNDMKSGGGEEEGLQLVPVSNNHSNNEDEGLA
ncbi:hypothetical protein MLD38_007117 [Melastoma candidum]|uniref:Uncharacterized protein n=1 Tax=Melastoma candidum TaxID=119954 RepID=A0ACB9RPT0_9MYRT|nr:hypothetical protein MLD38_007117 [Melastoma candidum]